MENIESCPICGALYFEGHKTCKCPPKIEMKQITDDKKPFARDRRHNYRTDGMPPQMTDKHIDELK